MSLQDASSAPWAAYGLKGGGAPSLHPLRASMRLSSRPLACMPGELADSPGPPPHPGITSSPQVADGSRGCGSKERSCVAVISKMGKQMGRASGAVYFIHFL
jgi:hypothetical protein